MENFRNIHRKPNKHPRTCLFSKAVHTSRNGHAKFSVVVDLVLKYKLLRQHIVIGSPTSTFPTNWFRSLKKTFIISVFFC